MSSDRAVYRSTHPDVLKIWNDYDATAEEWQERINAFLAEHGFTGRNVHFNTTTNSIYGVKHDDGEVPAGWRIDRKYGYLVPRLTSKAGKVIDAQLGELRRPDPREMVPGMPKNCLAGRHFMTCAMRSMAGAIYVTWPRPIPESQVDLSIWERVKLSEYYAVVEAEEAAGEARDV
ncbi:hypothetical protein [Planobispora rosea]|uniref:hypothetical protein n=1 Tax=Planobispora rosea TaxID=35762 RepID=UPI00083AB1C2|nr:hypothetical protein [Planobispora rosea]